MQHTKRSLIFSGACGALLFLACATLAWAESPTELTQNLFVAEAKGGLEALAQAPAKPIQAILARINAASAQAAEIQVDYPFPGTVFPPEIVPAQFIWHDKAGDAKAWLVDVAFEGLPHHIYVLATGKRFKRAIDPHCVAEDNVYEETPYQASAQGWIPSDSLWELIKRYSIEKTATVAFYGLDAIPSSASAAAPRIVSSGKVAIQTSKDPVAAPIFYRDVPIMPAKNTDDMIKPLAASAVAMIQWRVRDISQPEAPVVMKDMPTCANCHSFAQDGHTLGMDMDGPSAEGETTDKGAYFVKTIEKRMVVEEDDIFSWNDYKDKPKDKDTIGLFPQVSPDGKAVATTINESIFISNYQDYRFCQTFYATRGIIAIYNREAKEIRALPGADSEEYVQSNPVWSPDGKWIVFVRAKARERYGPGPRPTYANAPEETQIQFDLYRIPYNDGKGGVAEPLAGASQNGMSNSFAKFSPDGKWIVFVQARNGLLMRPDSKLYIIPAEGGEARLMNCNTTLMNSWHSWSPNGRWLVFSSKSNTPYTEMFLTHIDENGVDTPAVLIPNSTLANRAINIPEFFNNSADSLQEIVAPAVDYRRRMRKGLDYLSKGMIEEALTELQESNALRPDYPDALYHLGQLLAEQGKLGELVEKYRAYVQSNPNSAEAHTNLGVALCMASQSQEGLQEFQRAVELDPEYAPAYTNWAFALMRTGDLDTAIRHFRKVVELEPNSESAHCNLGDALLGKREIDEAVRQYNLALGINSKSAKAQTHWGVALLRTATPEASVAHFQQALDFDPKYAPAHMNWGIALMSKGDFAEAARRFEAFIELNPEDAAARNHLGNALMSLGQVDRAAGQFQHALRLDPEREGPHYSLGDICAGREQFDEAIEHYRQEARINPRNAEVHVDWGQALARQQKKGPAMEQFQKALEIDPKSERALYFHAGSLCMLSQFDKAATQFEKLLAINPRSAPAHTQYAMVLLELRRVDEAATHLRQALEINPQDQRARDILSKIQKR